jgi:hypothetical protein
MDKFLELIEQLEEEDEESSINIKETKLPRELVEQYERMKKIESYMGIQMRMPFELKIN